NWNRIYRIYIKRVIELVVALPLLILLSHILLLVSILIITTSDGPLFFSQTRVGKNLKNFRIYKFRTMTDHKHEVKKRLGKTDDITKVGYYLRTYKIDELPQIFNVLRAEMSLVGPRPSIPQQLIDLSKEEKRRYVVRPGMTGLAQVCGNIHISWKERYEYDLKYIGNISLINDAKIGIRTILIIITGEKRFKNQPLKIREVG